MPPSSPPVFGRKNLPLQPQARTTVCPAPQSAPPVAEQAAPHPIDQAAFFAAARATVAPAIDDPPRVVPRSFKAALLAGLVVGCALAGFDASDGAGTRQIAAAARLAGTEIDASRFAPVLILLALLGGARAAATTVLVVNTALRKANQTSHMAYALGGAVAAAMLAGAVLALFAHPPAHGWAVEIAAGAACGFVYRVFAGARPAS